jgi:small-conductance mechanosensitive channel
LLLTRGRHWAGLALKRLRSFGGQGTGVWRFLVSLFRIILPLLGLYAIVVGIETTGIAGPKLRALLADLPVYGAILLGFRWLAERLFARDEEEALIPLDSAARSAARFWILILSILFVLRGLVDLVLGVGETSPATEPVMTFPIIVSMGVILFRLGQIFRTCKAPQSSDDTDESEPRGGGLAATIRWTGMAVMGVAIAAPVMAAAGFGEAGNALLFPTIFSLIVLGLVIALQRFAADVYGLISGKGIEGRDALIPVLIGFVLLLLSMPLILLAWGMRPAELMELWETFAQGFQVGNSRISPTDFLTFALIFVIGYTLTRLVQGALRTNVLPKTRIDAGGQNAILSGLGYLGIFLSAVVAITTVGIDLSSIAIVAGALSVGIGFGLQTIVSNFISGIILLIERPISEGDWIEVGGQQGYVRHISVRSTRIETFDRSDVIVPNADLISGTVTNFTRGNTVGRLIVDVGVAYGTDSRRVEKILQEIADAQPMVLRNPPPMILFNAFGADALEFQIRMILRDVNWMMVVKNDVNHAIAKRFAEEGIEIPFAQRDLWLRNPEVLKGSAT